MSDPVRVEYQSTPAIWSAYVDPEGRVGYGKTREEALIALVDDLYDDWATAMAERDKAKRALSDTARVHAMDDMALAAAQEALRQNRVYAEQLAENLEILHDAMRLGGLTHTQGAGYAESRRCKIVADLLAKNPARSPSPSGEDARGAESVSETRGHEGSNPSERGRDNGPLTEERALGWLDVVDAINAMFTENAREAREAGRTCPIVSVDPRNTIDEFYHLIQQIERCGASEDLTKAVVMAGDMRERLKKTLGKFKGVLLGFTERITSTAPATVMARVMEGPRGTCEEKR